MKKRLVKQGVTFVMALMLLCSCMTVNVDAAKYDVKPSETNYYVEFNDSDCVFLCNQNGAGTKVGTEYYLTYTVESMEMESVGANGVLASNQPGARWPYVDNGNGSGGLMNHNIMNQLLVEGNTYFAKFTITKDGYEYRVANALDGEGYYMKFSSQAGEARKDAEHFGVWLGHGGMTGKLTKVRAYDKYGNDLGVRVTGARNATVGRETSFKKNTKLNHRYTVEINEADLVAISTKRMATSDKVFMEYRVKSSDAKLAQWGGIMGTSITGRYPYLTGYMRHENVGSGKESKEPLLVEGAEYILVFEKVKDRVDLVVQRTLNGKVTSYVPSSYYGTYDEAMKHYALWLGSLKDTKITAVLEDFKCYDSNGNNLGVQCLLSNVLVTHYGELENYEGCEALYANEDKNTLFALYADKTLKVTTGNDTKVGTFAVEGGIMTTEIEGEKNEYEYQYQAFKDAEGNIYKRVGTCKIVFETGEGTKVETQILNEENGYQVMKPTDPTLEGNTFEGWYTLEGEKFEFEKLTIDSITLYAKWAETEWTEVMAKLDIAPYLFAASAVLILVAGGVCGGILLRKGKRHDKDNQEK